MRRTSRSTTGTTRLLLTGDSLYPGRLYVFDWPALPRERRAAGGVCCRGNPVELVLGAHIELTTKPGQDFEMGADRHPDEHELQLRPDVLTELAEVIAGAGESRCGSTATTSSCIPV